MTMCVCGWDESDPTLWMEDGKAAAAVAMQVLENGVVCSKCSGMASPMLQSILDAVEQAGDDADADVEEVCVVAAHRFVVKSRTSFTICVAKYDDDDGSPMFVDLSTAFNLTDCGSCDGQAIVNSDALCMGSEDCFAALCSFCEDEGVDVCRKCDPTAPRREDPYEDDAFMLIQMVTQQGWDTADTMPDLADAGSMLFHNRRCFKEDSVVACVMAGSDGDVEAWWTKRISDSENKWEFHTPTPVKCAHAPVKRRRV